MAREKIEPSFKKRNIANDGADASARLLRARKPKRKRTWPYVLALLSAWIVVLVLALVAHLWAELPDVSHLPLATISRDITILDQHGRLIARKNLTQGATINVRDLPIYVPDAFIAIEDRRFREHIGVDVFGVARAALEDLAVGHVVQGGSTITQQLAKNLFLQPKRTFDRKGQEALLALYLESHYSKDQILTLYLNRVYFGAGVYGIEAASERFFGRPAAELSLSEAAILAGSVKAPAKYNPLADPEAAQARAATVLKAMREAGFIDQQTKLLASETAPRFMQATGTPGAGYFVDWVMSRIPNHIDEIHEPIVVTTTFDLPLQEKAEQAVEVGLTSEGQKLDARQAALVALAPDGAVRAMVGGRSYASSPYNRAADAKRQPGSAFKPFVYLTAIERGHHLDDVMYDAPMSFGKWRPGNYEGRYEGHITLTRAFADSSNSVAAQLTVESGPRKVVETAHRLGIASRLTALPSLALGSETVTPLELTAAYAPFANGGERALPYAIREIRTKTGHVLYRRKPPGQQRVMTAGQAGEMAQLMVATVTTGTGRAAQLDERPSAGKTGTTQDFRDAWFVGFTSDYVCGVWVGNDHNTRMVHASGGTLPSHIFKSFMEEAEKGLPVQPLTSIRLASTMSTVASVDTSSGNAQSAASSADTRGFFERLLDRLFGRH